MTSNPPTRSRARLPSRLARGLCAVAVVALGAVITWLVLYAIFDQPHRPAPIDVIWPPI